MKSKKIIAIVMAIILVAVIAIPAVLAIPEEPVPLRLVYKESTKKSGDSYVKGASPWESNTLPIGNGKLGANIFGETDEDVLTINEETLWGGGRTVNYDGGNPDPNAARNAYTTISNKLLNDQQLAPWEMEALKGDGEDGGYHEGYLPLGKLRFSGINHAASNYERALNLDDGMATVKYTANGVNYSREYFANHDSNVIVVRFDADKNSSLSFTTTFELKDRLNANFKQTSNVGADNIGYITYAGTVSQNGLKHNTQVAVIADSGSVTKAGNGIKVTGANSVTVYLTSATDYKNQFAGPTMDYYYRTGDSDEQLDAKVASTLRQAVNKGFKNIRAEHLTDYQELYNRVDLDLGQKDNSYYTDDLLTDYRNNRLSPANQRYLEVLLFQYGRYLLISGSREDSQIPTTLQGIWNDTAKIDWDSDLHTNINLQMNYWLSNNCNLTECALPLVNYVAKLKEPGHITSEMYTGSKHGFMVHTQHTPFGYTGPGWEIGRWGWSSGAAAWLMQNCYDYYQYSQDKTTLENVIYPMLKEQVLMYQDILREKNGRMIMPIALSPEIGPVTAGNTFEQSIIAQLYKDTIEAAKILGEDSDLLPAWEKTASMLKPIEIGQSGQIKEWYHETTINSVVNTSGHRHLSNLLGLFPGDIVDTPEEIAAAKVSLNNKNFGAVGKTGNNPEGGWSYGQLIPSWARVGEADNAYFCVKQMIQNRLFENLWDYHNAAIFQIDGNYGYSAGVAEMLIQSNLGYIKFLPAISKEWANGSVKGLLAEGNFTVDMEWKNSELQLAHITAKNAGECKFENPFGTKKFRLLDENGREVNYVKDENGICRFTAKAGVQYTVKTVAPLNVHFERNAEGHVVLKWDAQPGVEYKIFRKEITL